MNKKYIQWPMKRDALWRRRMVGLLGLLIIGLPFALSAKVTEMSNGVHSITCEIISGGSGTMTGTLTISDEGATQGAVQLIVGQPFISANTMSGTNHFVNLGFWSTMLRVPGTPFLNATYDLYSDRIELDWRYDPNDPPGNGNHKIYRNYEQNPNPVQVVYSGTFQWTDNDLPAGESYTYRVQGSNKIKYASTYQPIEKAGTATGKTSTNGAISGVVTTTIGNPVPDVRVRVMNDAGTAPAWGHSVFLSGTGQYAEIAGNDAFDFFDQSVNDSTTLELWFRPDNSDSQTLISKGAQWAVTMHTDVLSYLQIDHDGEAVIITDHVQGTHDSQAIRINEWNHLALVRSGDLLKVYLHGKLMAFNNGSEETTVSDLPSNGSSLLLGSDFDQAATFRGNLDEFRIWNIARDEMFMEPYSDMNANGQYDAGEYFTDINGNGQWGESDSTLILRDYTRIINYREEGEIVQPHLTAYFNMNLGSGNKIVNTVEMGADATLMGDVAWTSSQAPVYPTGYTDDDGAYQIKNINFGEGMTFRVIPFKAFHQFNSPGYARVTLNEYNSTNNTTDFQVTNMISISGYVLYDPDGAGGASCGEKDVEIWVDGDYTGYRTNNDGYYLFEVEPGRTLTISANKNGRELFDWSPQTKTFFNVIAPQSHNFIDLKRRTLRGKVSGGQCAYPVLPAGKAKVILRSTSTCFSDTSEVSGNGHYAFENIPIMNYSLSVDINPVGLSFPESVYGENYLENMLSFFDGAGKTHNMQNSYSVLDSAWVSEEDTIHFNWRAPIMLEDHPDSIGFLSLSALVPTQNELIARQNIADTLNLKVIERYYGGNCLLDTGVIHIRDYVSDRYVASDEASDTLYIQFGTGGNASQKTAQVHYPYLPGLPELSPPYKKNMEFVVSDTSGIRQYSKQFKVVVLGHKPQTVDGVTVAPEIPFIILRRPPGDGSFASFSETQSASLGFSLSLQASNSQEFSVESFLGVKVEILTAPMGVGTSTEADAKYTLAQGFGIEMGVSSNNSLNFVTTTSTEYTTATAVELMGDRGTVFVGGAMNLLYGATRILDWRINDNQFEFYTRDEVMFVPDGFKTTFIFSRGYIEDYLLPELAILAQDSSELNESITRWEGILAYEDSLRWATDFQDNYTFSGGGQQMTISHSKETSSSMSVEEYLQLDYNFAQTMGLEVGGSGASATAKCAAQFKIGAGIETGFTRTSTSSFTLSDDDTGDDYSVNVGTDPVYGTPVFAVEFGNSSCPYEEWHNENGEIVTTPRDEPGLSWMTPSTLVNVLPGSVAEFWIQLQNDADNIDPRTYELCYLTASNPHGAIIKINGQHANESNPITYELAQYGVDSALITVEHPQNSDVYEFDDLRIKFAPPCETNYAGVTQGFTEAFNVRFARPCTNADFYQPNDNWILNKSGNDTLQIIVTDYDLNQSYFNEIQVQYSPVGQSTWYSVDTLDADTLKHYMMNYAELLWPVGDLDDGLYELRLRTVCLDGLLITDYPPISGIIDRTAPTALGLPEPVDGVLNMNDEIAINFSENIQPESVKLQNVSLHDKTTDDIITDFELTISPERMVISPGMANYHIENHTLEATLTEYLDMQGNRGDTLRWTFVVNRNPVSWNASNIEKIAIIGEANEFIIRLNNIGSSAEAFEIQDLPYWLMAEPFEGEINPGGSFDIHFFVEDNLNVGEFTQTIYANTSKGKEPLTVKLISMCPYPEWTVQPSDYEFSMNISARLYVKGTLSEDDYDRIGAFVGRECRGMANLIYDELIDDYLCYLTVYSNQYSGETIEFHTWDRTECEEYWAADTTLIFQSDSYAGTPSDPLMLNFQDIVAQEIPYEAGYNWFSVNIINEDSDDLNALFDNLALSDGDRLINHYGYAQYSAADSQWYGNPGDTRIDLGRMYIFDLENSSALDYIGQRVGADTLPLPVESGWNWLGYLPNQNMPVDDALVSLGSSQNDLIKDQTHFAQYVAGIGWIGSLSWMRPGKGYKLLSAADDTLHYPVESPAAIPALAKSNNQELLSDLPWTVNHHQFSRSMTLTALLESDTMGVNDPADIVYAWKDKEPRGFARPEYVPALDEYRLFMMIYGEPGEAIEFRIYDSSEDIVYRGNEILTFQSDDIIADPMNPLILSKAPLQIGDKGYVPEVFSLGKNYPNPFNPSTKIGFGLPEPAEVSIRVYNVLGQQVKMLISSEMSAGYRFLVWNGTNEFGAGVSSGIYLVVMDAKGINSGKTFHQTQKMAILK
jgi:hypothetical protein